ncbi:hypothetical protein FKM82_030222, partial [Ascaphus truei]
ADNNASKQKISGQPIFKANITLSIPNISMVPALDEVQQTLNKAVENIVKVTKGVSQWSKERMSKKKILERKIAAMRRNSKDSDSEDSMVEVAGKNTYGNLHFLLSCEITCKF